MSVIGASLVKEAQTRVLMIACCEPQMTATALSASRAGSRPAMQPAVAASSPRISMARARGGRVGGIITGQLQLPSNVQILCGLELESA